jgi:hypothetical protein
VKGFIFIAIAALSFNVSATDLCDWPDPGFKIGTNERNLGIAKSAYDKALDQVETVYSPLFKKMGYGFELHRTWSDGTVNAQAWWEGSTCNVEIFGGIARWPGITATAVRQVALHEIGHCLGGDPEYPGENMSCEGQADYYSSLIGCRLFGVSCKASSLNLAKALASMGGEQVPSRPGPVLKQVKVTNCDHPAAQCRLDTYDAGIAKYSRPGCWFKQ